MTSIAAAQCQSVCLENKDIHKNLAVLRCSAVSILSIREQHSGYNRTCWIRQVHAEQFARA